MCALPQHKPALRRVSYTADFPAAVTKPKQENKKTIKQASKQAKHVLLHTVGPVAEYCICHSSTVPQFNEQCATEEAKREKKTADKIER